MNRLLRTLALVVSAMLVVFMVVGCGSDEEEEPDVVAANFVSSTPADGGDLPSNGTLTLTFSAVPENVTVNGKAATVSGKTASLAGPHAGSGTTAFAIAWDNGPDGSAGSATVSLNVIAPDTTAPTVTKKNFADKDADPEPLNTDGIVIEFSETIASSTLKLTLEDGTDLGWLPEVADNIVTFTPLKGKELGNETTYKVAGTVKDAAGNETTVDETFVTKGKE